MPAADHDRLSTVRAGLTLFSAVCGSVAILIRLGFPHALAVGITALVTAGAVEVACSLTEPFHAPKARATVVVIVLVFTLGLVVQRVAPAAALAIGLATAVLAAQAVRRLSGLSYRPPRFIF